MKRLLSIIIIGFCVATLLPSQTLSVSFSEKTLEDYTITQMNTKDGFLQDGVMDLWQDQLGYIWLFNQSGLIQMDRSEVKIHSLANNNIITNHRIAHNIPLRDGSILVNYIVPKSTFLVSPNGQIKGLEPKGDLRISRYLEQLSPKKLCYTPEKFIPDFAKPNTTHLNNFLYADPNKKAFYVISADTTYYYVEQQLTKKIALANRSQLSLAEKPPMGTVLNINQALFFLSLKNKKLGPFIQVIEVGELGTRHSITDEAFLASINNASYFNYFHSLNERCIIQVDESIWELSIEDNSIKWRKILEDLPIKPTAISFDSTNKLLYLSDAQHGLFILDQKKDLEYFSPDNVPPTSFDEIRPGLIANHNKFYSLEGEVVKTTTNLHLDFWKKISPTHIIAADKRAQIWDNIDTPSSDRIQLRPNPLYIKDYLKDALIDPAQHLWLASMNYITVYDLEKQTRIAEYAFPKPYANIHPPFCLALHPNQKEIWAGTTNGVYSFDIQSFQVKKLPFLEGVPVRAIQFYDDIGLLGTYGEGAFAIQNGKISSLTNDPNSSLLFAHAFVEDSQGFIWISTNNGLLKAAKAEIKCFLQGECPEIYYHRFTTQDGLASNEFNGGVQPCGIKLSNGHLAFSSMRGILHFDPAEISITALPKKIIIEEGLLNGQAIDIGSKISLPPRFQQLTLKVKTEAYWGSQDNLIFQYRIKGFNDSWLAVPNDGLININRFDHGAFNLELRIHQGLEATKKGLDKYVYKQIDLDFQSRLTESFTFFIFLFALGILITYLIYRTRLYYHKKQNKVLTTLVKSKTAELHDVNRELKEENSVKNLMLSIFHHDIAGNLRYLSLLTRGLQSNNRKTQLNQETNEDFDLLATTIHNLNTQTQGYLNWIHLNRKSANISLSNIRLLPIVEQIRDSLQKLAQENNKHIVHHLDAQMVVHSHLLIIKSLLLNIIDNYIKYGDSNQITITGDILSHSVQIAYETVSDFELPLVNQFFSEDHNVDKEITFISPERKDSGGLGFYIIRDLLRRNKAQLQLSRQAKTIIYTITFPAAK